MFNDDWDYNVREMERELDLMDRIADKKMELLESRYDYKDPENRRYALMKCVYFDCADKFGLTEEVRRLKEALANNEFTAAKECVNTISSRFWDSETEDMAVSLIMDREYQQENEYGL